MSLQGKLLLAPLSLKIYPELSTYETINQVDLQLLDNIDSAGLAYLVQIKSHFPSIIFVGVSQKMLILSHLYGVNFIFT
ncbi:hypothetical protein JI57_04370 [Psychromonas sp. PRT-SC03]|nr:hypothetical protein JI57_04370 [Psychromonas sp. PRT-SC03]